MMRSRTIAHAFCISALSWLLTASVYAQPEFVDTFDRADGEATGWTVALGEWQILDERLFNVGAGAESWAWAGDPPIVTSGDLIADVTVEFLGDPPLPVGRHGGFMIYASTPTHRNDGLITGYTIDWIDRDADHGMRLIRWDGGSFAILAQGTGGLELPDPPSEWRFEIEGESIFIYGDDELILEAIDDTYREGHFGAWAWANNTQTTLDELSIDFTPAAIKACANADITTGGAPLTVNFDASCSSTSTEIVSYEWDFGDGETGSGAMVAHEYLFADNYVATLTVEDSAGNTDETTIDVAVFEIADDFSDEFDREDGPVTGWTPFSGTWELIDERLTNLVEGGEAWAWAGEPPLRFGGNMTAEVELEFMAPDDGVGKHGGLMFFASMPNNRWDASTSGYTIDWIDRIDDHGFRFIRIDNGEHTPLHVGTPEIADPPLVWKVEVEGELIRVFGDDELVVEVADGTYRAGAFSVWAYSNTQVLANRVDLRFSEVPVTACMTATPETGTAPLTVEFDASCSEATTPITAYRWDFGDGTMGEGAQVSHEYTAGDTYTATLTVEDSEGNTSETSRTVRVFDEVLFWSDSFNREPGDLGDWTIVEGDWQIVDDALVVDVPAAPEAWIYAGDPPLGFGGVFKIEVDVSFLNDPGDIVGRHGGIFFFGSGPNPRGMNSGYSIDWIDREADHGYRISVWTDGVETSLIAGTDDVDPGTTWTIGVDDEKIWLDVDGERKVEVFDTTYRVGHIGFWSYFNGQRIAYDNFKVNDSEVPPIVFRRGDSNDDGTANIADAINSLNFLFADDGVPPACEEAADVNDDGTVNIADPINLLNNLFGDGEPPVGGVDCQEADETALDCTYTNC